MHKIKTSLTTLRYSVLLAMLSASITPVYADQGKDAELEKLNRELTAMQKRLAALETNENAEDLSAKGEFTFAATLRPTLGYGNDYANNNGENDDRSWNINDALSFVTTSYSYEFMPGWTVTAHGEFDIRIGDNGDLGRSRQAFVALDTPVGRIGLGKQRPAQYTFIGGYLDIFNHANSPFAFDAESIFFVDNFLTYKKKHGDFTYMAAAQLNGAGGSDANDIINAGVSFDRDNFHFALTYLDQKVPDGIDISRSDEVFAGAIAHTFANGLYTAAAYQDRTYQAPSGSQREGDAFDIAIAYPFLQHYKIKMGYFAFDDGFEIDITRKYDGYNLTLEWQPIAALRFHLEYLTREFDQGIDDTFSTITLGVRYDYAFVSQFY